ncbi:MAG: cytochrome c [Azospirillaceae bacterium]
MKTAIAFGAAAAAVMIAVGGMATTAVRAQSPEAQVEARQDYMKSLGGAAKTAGDYFQKGEGTLDEVRAALKTLGEKAPDLEAQFPEGTGVGVADSEALATVWEEPDAFAEVVGTAQERWQAAAAIADEGGENELKAAFAQAGQACGACHEDFRQQD